MQQQELIISGTFSYFLVSVHPNMVGNSLLVARVFIYSFQLLGKAILKNNVYPS
jgi:hypothetical protein